MYKLFLLIHFLACFLLIVVILLQSGKGSAAGIFGSSSGGDNVFSAPTAASAINRFTMILAIIIAITSISLTILVSKGVNKSVVDNVKAPMVATEQQKAE